MNQRAMDKVNEKAKAMVLMVCSANVCRSPVAEHLLRDRLQRAGVSGIAVESAGAMGMVPIDVPASCVSLLAERGLDVSGHRSKRVDEAMLERATLVLCMAGEHVERLRTCFPDCAAKVHLLASMAGEGCDSAGNTHPTITGESRDGLAGKCP